MRKITICMLIFVCILAICTLSFGATGKVNTDTARVRSEASSSSSIVDLLSINDKVEVIEQSGDWYKIKFGNKTGYISKSLLDMDGTVEKKEEQQEKNVETKENVTEQNNENTAKNTEKETTNTENKTIEIKDSFVGKVSSEITIKILPSINSTDIAKIEKDSEWQKQKLILFS